MKNFLFFFLICITLFAPSCQKEDEFTPSELIAKELQSVIKDNAIERVMDFNLDQNWGNTMILGDFGKNYKFQGQFIFIEGESYNLNNLIKYQIASKNNESGGAIKFLLLSFY